jgi:tryptophan synthase alpha chain
VSRLDETFARLRPAGRTGLITYTTAGDPDLPRSGEILKALDRAGADVLEVGVPFSIRSRTVRSSSGRPSARWRRAVASAPRLALIAEVRPVVSAPVVVFTYANPLLRLGLNTFARQAAEAGVDGVLVLDLPIEEAGAFRETLAASQIDMIFLLSPTTTDARIQKAAELGRGFLYGISRLGVTGARDRVASGAEALVRRIRAHSSLPVALGFGISRPAHVAEVGAYADAVVVGSALVSIIAEGNGASGLTARVEEYVRWLRSTN